MTSDRKKFISGRVVFVLCAALLNVQPSSLQSGDGIREDDEEGYDIATSCPTCRLEDPSTCKIDSVDEVGCFPDSDVIKRGRYPGKPENVNVTASYIMTPDKYKTPDKHCTRKIHLRWSLPTKGSRFLTGFEVVLMNSENARFCRRIPYISSTKKTAESVVFEYCLEPRIDDLYHVIVRSLPTPSDSKNDDVTQEIEINKANCVVTVAPSPEDSTTTFAPPTDEPIPKQSTIIIVVYILLPVVSILIVVFIIVVIIRLRKRDNNRLLQRLIETEDHMPRSESFDCTKCGQQKIGSTFSPPSECQDSHSELQTTTRLFTGVPDQLKKTHYFTAPV